MTWRRSSPARTARDPSGRERWCVPMATARALLSAYRVRRRFRGMVSGTFTKTIDAPPTAVWPWIGQLEKHADWSPKTYKAELVSGEPGAVGSRYRSVGWVPGDKQHSKDVTIVEMVPEQRLELRSDDPQGSFKNAYTLRPVGAGTEVTYEIVFPE